MSGPLPGVERPKRPPPPKVKPQRPPPPAPVCLHPVDGSTRPKLASHVSPKRHLSASTQFSRVEQGNPLFGAIKDEDDILEEMPVAQVERITDPLGCRTWEKPVTAAVKKGRTDGGRGVVGGGKKNEEVYVHKQTAIIKEEESMKTPAETHPSGLDLSASFDSASSDSDDLFHSINSPLFPDPDFDLTENPTVGGILHGEAAAPDVELPELPGTSGKVHSEAAAPDLDLTEYPGTSGKVHGEAAAPDLELTEYPGTSGKVHGEAAAPDLELPEYPGTSGKVHGEAAAPDLELPEYPGTSGKVHGEAAAPDLELTEYPGTSGKVHGEAAAPDLELTEYPSVGGQLHGESEHEVDYNGMPLCEDHYASIPDNSCDLGKSPPLEETEEHPLHKDSVHVECSRPLTHTKPEQAEPQQLVPVPSDLPAAQHTSQSEAVPPVGRVEALTGTPVKGRAEAGRVSSKVKVPLQDVLIAMRKDLKAKDPSRADKEEMDEPLLSWSMMLGIALTNYFYLCFGFSSFLSGFLTGIYVFFLLLAGVIGFLSYYEVMKRDLLEKLRMEAEKEEREQQGAFNNLKLNTLPPLKSELFTVAYNYDCSLRKTSVTHPVRINLNNFQLTIEVEAASVLGNEVSRRFWQYGEDRTIQERNAIMREVDMTSCHVYLAPDEVAKDRKRRWNKKYPICLHIRSGKDQECVLYLFVKVARDKEEWYRRMRNACSGITTAELAAQQTRFYHYISKYMPKDASHFSALKEVSRRVMTTRRSTQLMQLSQLSNPEGNDEGTSVDAPISSAVNQTTQRVVLGSMAENGGTHFRSTKGVGGTPALPKSYQDRGVHDQAKGPLQSRPLLDRSAKKPSNMSAAHLVANPDIASLGISPEFSLDWVNVLAARLCWDFWHEEKWRQWAMQKIDKKLRRLQRPSFLEELHVTDVQVGNDMPRIKRITSQPRWAGGRGLGGVLGWGRGLGGVFGWGGVWLGGRGLGGELGWGHVGWEGCLAGGMCAGRGSGLEGRCTGREGFTYLHPASSLQY